MGAVVEMQQQVTPDRVAQFFWGFAPPLIIESAIRNHIFDVIDAAPKKLKEICSQSETVERPTLAVVDALVGLGLLAKDKAGYYTTTPESSTFLVRNKPSFIGGLFRHGTAQLLPSFQHLPEMLRTGKSAEILNKETTGTDFFKDFVEDLFPLMHPGAATLAGHITASWNGNHASVLDLAAGSGVWGIAFAQVSPNVNVTALDWPGVLEITKKITERCGVANRYSYIAGDLLEADFGKNYSIATLGHILHTEGEARSKVLLKKTFQALADGGTIAIAEFLVNEDRTGPVGGLIFAVNMVVHTQEGYTYSFEEIRSWLEEAGFENVRTLQVPAESPLILADKPKSK